MFWNYRVVNLKSQNGGDDWYELQEVTYDDNNKPTDYSEPCLGSETYEGFVELFKDMITHAVLNEKPMQEEDFNG